MKEYYFNYDEREKTYTLLSEAPTIHPEEDPSFINQAMQEFDHTRCSLPCGDEFSEEDSLYLIYIGLRPIAALTVLHFPDCRMVSMGTHPAHRTKGHMSYLYAYYHACEGDIAVEEVAWDTRGIGSAAFLVRKGFSPIREDSLLIREPRTPIPPVSDPLKQRQLSIGETSPESLRELHFTVFDTELPMQEVEDEKWYIFRDRKLPVGFCRLQFFRDTLALSSYGILPELRERGYGSAFLSILLENLENVHPNTKVLLHLQGNNHAAANLYRNFGFRALDSMTIYRRNPKS